jgi:hypothetical protein
MNFLKRGFKAAKSAVNAIFGVRARHPRPRPSLIFLFSFRDEISLTSDLNPARLPAGR